MSTFQRAHIQSQQAANVGFDWPTSLPVAHKVVEEASELLEAVEQQHRDCIRHEIGDVCLALVSLARHERIDLESCFIEAIERFDARWAMMLKLKDTTTPLEELTPYEWNRLWEEAKVTLDIQQ